MPSISRYAQMKINYLIPSTSGEGTQVFQLFFNPIHDNPTTNFSSVTSTNVGISLQNFLTFSYNPFATRVQSFKVIPSANPNLLILNQDRPSKNMIFS